MERLPDWMTRAVMIGMLGWLAYTTHGNTAKIEGINARVTMLVQIMLPAPKPQRLGGLGR